MLLILYLISSRAPVDRCGGLKPLRVLNRLVLPSSHRPAASTLL